MDEGDVAKRPLAAMTSNEWQAHVTREAAKAIGRWLEGRGRLEQPIRCLTMADLEAMAANAISRFVVLGVTWVQERPAENGDLTRLLLG